MHRLVASLFGAGLILRRIRGSHGGSGTLGALAAAPPALAINRYLGWPALVIASAMVALVSLWSIRPLFESEGDAGWIVIDEGAGVFVAMIGLSLWPGAVVAFLVFRVADIFKRAFPGVARADAMPGAVGVTADDLIAGLYGLAAGHLVQALF